MATGYWRIKFNAPNFELEDHLPSGTARGSLQVFITVPGADEEESLTPANLGSYDASNPSAAPLTVEPADVTAETGSTFRDGVYRFRVTYVIQGATHVFDERILHVPVIDECIAKKLDDYLTKLCNKCQNDNLLRQLQELVVLRQGAQLDINAGRFTAAAKKVTLMSNICTGSSCTCVCGCE